MGSEMCIRDSILPTAVDVDVQTYRTVVSEPPALNVGLVEQGQGLGAPSSIAY